MVELIILVIISILFGMLMTVFYFTVLKDKPIVIDYSPKNTPVKKVEETDYKFKEDSYYEEEPTDGEPSITKDKIKTFMEEHKVAIVTLLIFSCTIGICLGCLFTHSLKDDIMKVKESKKIGIHIILPENKTNYRFL